VKKIYQKSPKTIEREELLKNNKKRCSKCDDIKGVTEFYKNKKIKCGYDSWCKECQDNKKSLYYSQSLYYQKSPKSIEREELLKDNKKRCTKCKDIKSLDSFSPDKNVKCGYTSWCKECHKDNSTKNRHKEHLIRKEKNPEYYLLREERKKLLQQGKYKCYSCKEIKEVSKFQKSGNQFQYCIKCNEEKSRQKKILNNPSKDPDYYIRKEEKRIKREKEKKEKDKIREEKNKLLKEGKKKCLKCETILPIDNFKSLKKYHCISCNKEQRKKEKILYKKNKSENRVCIKCNENVSKDKFLNYECVPSHSVKICKECYDKMESIVCNKCEIEKPLSSYGNNKKSYLGKESICKSCRSTQKELRHKEKMENNPEYAKNYREKKNKYSRDRRLKFRKEREKSGVVYKKKVKVSKKKKRKVISKEKKKVYGERSKLRRKLRLKTDVVYKLKINLRRNIRKSIKNNGYTKKSNTYTILGCSYEYFKEHIESQFEDWMSWDNYGLYNGEENYGWDLDHIVPLSSAECEEDIIRLNHHSNIQPLCSHINRNVKRDIIDWES
jgi:hypothetical protein